MEDTIPDENINPDGKQEAEIMHAERVIEDDLKGGQPSLTNAQIRRFRAVMDIRVLPMLGVIYAVSILDRINVCALCLCE